MKTERRHELQTNVLADWLGHQVERLAPYSRAAGGAALAVVAVIGALWYFSAQSSATHEQGWTAYFEGMDSLRQATRNPDRLVTLAQSPDYQKTAVGYWAAISVGDYYLAEGINNLFNDRAAAKDQLQMALTNYAQVADQTKFPSLAERATLGMARTYEAQNELEKARSTYQAILTKWPDGSYDGESKQRLEDLKLDSTKRFYDWFFTMTPPRTGIGGPGVPGMRPPFDRMPTESEGFRLPPAESGPPAEGGATKASEPPANDAAQSAPADTKSTEDAPATEPATPPDAAPPGGDVTPPGGDDAAKAPAAKTP